MFKIRRLESLESNSGLKSMEICGKEPLSLALSLALSRRERGLAALDVGDTPT
jgi:hypothetical protein